MTNQETAWSGEVDGCVYFPFHNARRAEEGINQTVTWYDTRHTMRAEILTQRTENVPRRYMNQQETSAKEIERKPERIPN